MHLFFILVLQWEPPIILSRPPIAIMGGQRAEIKYHYPDSQPSHSATGLEFFSRSRKSHHFEGVKTGMEWISYTIRCWIRCWKFQVSTLGLTLLTLVLNSGVEQVSRPRLFNDWLSSSSSCWGCLKKWNSVSNFGLELVLNSGVELVLIWSSWAVP